MHFLFALLTTVSMAAASDKGFVMDCTPMDNPSVQPAKVHLVLDDVSFSARFNWRERDWNVKLDILTILEQMGVEDKWVFFLVHGSDGILRFSILDTSTMNYEFDQRLDCRLVD